ncbi:210_t:CDS:1, partial [Acaulospora colombiana]
DGFVSPFFPKHKETDVATLYSAASIKSVPVPIRQFGLVQQQEPVRSHTVSHSQSGFRSLLRRSITSFEGTPVGMAISPGQMSGKNTTMQQDEVEDAARLAYESREVAADAQPVRPRADFCIPGTQGIVRSVVLNDRWHALTVDTMGHVGVWDIARGQCIGKYEKVDVEEALRADAAKGSQKQEYKWSPREALEVVRERVEGEAV